MQDFVKRLDMSFSDFIRGRADWTCESCHEVFPVKPGLRLQCSHYFTRDYFSTRFHPDNADSFCWECHANFSAHKNEPWTDKAGKAQPSYQIWKIMKIGVPAFNALHKLAFSGVRPDLKQVALRFYG